MRGFSRTTAGRFVRLEVVDPDGVVGLSLLPDDAAAWAAAIAEAR